jgi:hypothetical protein
MQDPFKEVRNLSTEIGQSTFTELISVTLAEDKAISQRTSIRNSISRLAYGKGSDPSPKNLDQIIVGNQYNYSSNPVLLTQKYRLINEEFRNIVKNSLTEGNLLCNIDNNISSCTDKSIECPIDIAFVLDNTGSMRALIDKVVNGLETLIGYIQQISNDYRMSYMTFGDCEDLVYRIPFTCGNIDQVIANIKSTTLISGGPYPEASNVAISDAMSGKLGSWRGATVKKLLVLVTDAPPGGCTNTPPNSPEYLEIENNLRSLATSAADCGIAFLVVYSDHILNTEFNIYKEITEITSGRYVLTKNGDDIPNLLASYVFSICGNNTVSSDPECSDVNNAIINGKFDNSIVFWDGLGATWSEQEQALLLKSQPPVDAYAEQFIPTGFWVDREDIRPGTTVSLGFDVKGVKGYVVKYTFFSGDNTITGEYVLQDNYIYERVTVYTTLASVGVTGVSFSTAQEVLIDNVFVCASPSADCPGATNLLRNPNFNQGVEFWEDENGPIFPTDDPNYWDQDIKAAILSLDGTLILRQTLLSDISEADGLTFYIIKNEPYDIGELGIKVRVYQGNSSVQKIIYNGDIEGFPHRVTLDLPEFSSSLSPSPIIVEFSTGPGATLEGYSGYTLIKGVSICKKTAVSCPEDTLNYADFKSSRSGWAGGLLELNQNRIKLTPDEVLTQTFTDLVPGSKVTLSYSSTAPQVTGTKYTLISGEVTNSGDYTGPQSIFVQSDGLLTVRIANNKSNPDLTHYYINSILLCKVDPVFCEGTVKGLQAGIEWRTMPKYPVNLITGFIKYDTRDYTNPDIVGTKYEIPQLRFARTKSLEQPGQLVPQCNIVDTCDAWKQQGVGSPLASEPLVLRKMLEIIAGRQGVNNYIKGIEIGQLEPTYDPSWGQFISYAFAIPSNKSRTVHDRCLLITPSSSINVPANIAKITVYLLMNQVVSNDPYTYYCGPLEDYNCNTDDDAFDVFINYANTTDVIREYRIRIDRNSLYTEQGSISNWDTPTELGNGSIIGPDMKARWFKVEFDIDNEFGTGLDQCSKKISPIQIFGSGELKFAQFQINGGASFIDPCESEIIIEAVAEGTSQNERQSIVLPNPTGGTWTLALRVGGNKNTATISGRATAKQVQAALENLNIIGPGNVVVTGEGTGLSPFIVEFIGDLAGLDLNMLEANGSNLLGSASGLVQTIQNGGVNERQRVYMADKNMVSLTLDFNGSKSALIPYNASLDSRQAIIEAMPSVGVGNVLITGDTNTRDTPYIGQMTIDFVEALGGTNIPDMVATPESSYNAVTVYNGGGNNEQQYVIVRAFGGNFRLKIYDPTFSGLLRLTLPPNKSPILSAFTRKSGTPINNNIPGSEIPDRPGLYEFNVSAWPDGDMIVDIADPIGRFCIRKLGISYYTGTTWSEVEEAYRNGADSSGNNGVGAPNDFDEHYWTTDIRFNASAAEVKTALAAAPFVGFTNLDVFKYPFEASDPNASAWRIEFKNNLGNIDMRQMQIDASGLIGGDIKVTETTKGQSTPESQRIKIYKAVAGYFNLVISIDDTEEVTDSITWNTSAEGLRESIAAHTKLGQSQVVVKQESSGDPEIVGQFLVEIRGHGNIPLIGALYQETLLCNPITLPNVPEPPYDYPLDCYEKPASSCGVNDCLPGPLPTKPCEGESPLELEPCCDPIRESANVALYYKLQRDLFDPNIKSANGKNRTIREVARSKNINTSHYNPYKRDFLRGTLELIGYDTVIESGMSIVLIDVQIDSNGSRYQVLKHLKNTREILPKRMIWPTNRLPAVN